MFQLQIFAVLLPLVSVYFLLHLYSILDIAYYNCVRHPFRDHHFTLNQTSSEHSRHCCGDTAGINLMCLFRFKGDQSNYRCREQPEFELSCEHNRTVLHLHLNNLQEQELYFYVEPKSIDQEKQTFRVIDPGVQKHNCSSLPLFSLEMTESHHGDISDNLRIDNQNTDVLIFVSCKNPVNSEAPLYVDTASCNITADHFSNNHNFSFESFSNYTYVVVNESLSPSDIEESCTVIKMFPAKIPSLLSTTTNISFLDIHNLLADGFQLTWAASSMKNSVFCYIISRLYGLYRKSIVYFRESPATFQTAVGYGIQLLTLLVAARNVIGVTLFLAFLIYKWHRRHLSMYDGVEEFLQRNNGLMPIRYSYKEIKAMTNNFTEKLGEGGYGLVYKGKSRSGSLVAVKMLSKSKANGQEFINEVATIGRIHHVNVVRLVGFCVTVSKRALVYDYMPNGSLDRFSSSECSNGVPINWKKTYEIVTGIARGIEYLHQGCDMQILHFDIKPHNILLDENFVPKVSDFGLAKLCPIQKSVATLTAVRGTLGYMAPELFYRKIGKVSCKADVYSFGMLLMEIAGRRRHLTERSSQIYYPSWVYDKFDKGEDLEIGDVTEEEKGIARKLILIALRCIQMTPADRPSMREVLKMLEADLVDLELPPKPLFYPPDSPILSQRSSLSSSEELTEPLVNSVALEIEQIDE